jgi:anti-sigma factor RsiW
MSYPHLSDDRLIEICFDLEPASTDRAHLSGCPACESRRARLASTIADAGDVMTREADEAFPVERLARQRLRILQRVDQDGRPGRVITFPNSHTQEGPAYGRRPARWATVAAAVAASFLVGFVADHLAHDVPGSRQAAPAPRQAVAAPSRPVLSDDEFLGQIELAASRVGPVALSPLDALTPGPGEAR